MASGRYLAPGPPPADLPYDSNSAHGPYLSSGWYVGSTPRPQEKASKHRGTALVDLPLELLDEVISYLCPIDTYAAKTSCTRLFTTRSPLRDVMKEFRDNPWDVHCAKVWSEKPGGQKLLCCLCRDTHDASYFDFLTQGRPPRLRSCDDANGAIEVAQSRLTMSAINLALKTYSPVLNEVDQSTTWPYHMHLLGVRAGLAMNCPSSSLLSPCHSPYEFDRDPDHGQYSLYQEIKEECGQLVLNSDLTLKLPERMTRAALGAETYDRAIQKWLADLKINGGLWLCPHIPTSDESFRELVSLLLHSFLDDCNCKIRFRCRYCDTAIKLSGFQDEVYDPEVTEYGEGNEEEEDDDDDQGDSTGMIVGMDELVVSLDKGLGRLEHPRNAKDPKISFSDKLSHHLSMRIPSNIQVLTTLASGTLS